MELYKYIGDTNGCKLEEDATVAIVKENLAMFYFNTKTNSYDISYLTDDELNNNFVKIENNKADIGLKELKNKTDIEYAKLKLDELVEGLSAHCEFHQNNPEDCNLNCPFGFHKCSEVTTETWFGHLSLIFPIVSSTINLTSIRHPSSVESPIFLSELTKLINKYSIENESDTPDYILADFLNSQLKVFAQATAKRDMWHAFIPRVNVTTKNNKP